MPQKRISFGFNGGMDQGTLSTRQNLGSFFQLQNFRYSSTQLGKLEQTPYWILASQNSRGTYYNGGSQTEPATSCVRMRTQDIQMTDYIISNGSGQIQVFYQSVDTVTETVNTGCYVVINSVTGLGINLGATLEIDIDGATTFQWKKNGGAYTSLVPITTAGVSIDGGNATVYFLASSGFAIGSTWTWTRTDAAFSATTNVTVRPAEYTYYKNELYFTATDDRLLVVRNSSTGQYAISVGYRPVYASYFSFYFDHLVVAGYYTSTVPYYDNLRNKRIAWSDVRDIHNFIATDVNEADTYTLPNDNQFDTVEPFNSSSFLVGIIVVRQVLFVFTLNECYYTNYLGLPIVFDFVKFSDVNLSGSISGTNSPVIRASEGAYLIGKNDIFLFDGGSLRSIGQPIQLALVNPAALYLTPQPPSYGTYHKYRDELVLATTDLLFVYQARYDRWFTRVVSFANTFNPKCFGVWTTELYVGGASRNLYREDSTWATAAPVAAGGSGLSQEYPRIVTCAWNDGFFAVFKEMSSTYITATIDSISSTYYSTAANCQIKLYWRSTDTGTLASTINAGGGISDTNAVLINTNTDGKVPYPRIAFRALALEVQLVGLVSNKPPGLVTLTGIEAEVSSPIPSSVER